MVEYSSLVPPLDDNDTPETPEVEEQVKEDDWGLPCDFFLFSQHQKQPVYVGTPPPRPRTADNNENDAHLQILCVESLTPLDMMNLSSGWHDATGHCVWTAAFFFTAVLTTGGLDDVLDVTSLRALELGSGTGLGGLALLQHIRYRYFETKQMDPQVYVTLTDADPAALDLCRRNAELNGFDEDQVSVQRLSWGKVDTTSLSSSSSLQEHSYDLLLACDILYDIRMLPAICESASYAAKKEAATFCLSHVPRACYNASTAPNAPEVKDLEGYIVHQITKDGHWRLQRIVRPLELPQIWEPPSYCINHTSLKEMAEVGTALLIFCREVS